MLLLKHSTGAIVINNIFLVHIIILPVEKENNLFSCPFLNLCFSNVRKVKQRRCCCFSLVLEVHFLCLRCLQVHNLLLLIMHAYSDNSPLQSAFFLQHRFEEIRHKGDKKMTSSCWPMQTHCSRLQGNCQICIIQHSSTCMQEE